MRDRYFPFHALGFQSNPFRALTDEEWADVVVLPPAVAEAEAHGGHLQIIGDLGRGKTSALLGLAARFRRDGRRAVYEYIAIGQDVFQSSLSGADIFLLDEAQRLQAAERRRLLGSARADLRLILGSHVDLAPLFKRAGLSLRTVDLGASDPAHLAALVARRLDYFALEAGHPGVALDPSAIQFLQATFGSNLRALERFLYEVFQSLEAPGVLAAKDLRSRAHLPDMPSRR